MTQQLLIQLNFTVSVYLIPVGNQWAVVFVISNFIIIVVIITFVPYEKKHAIRLKKTHGFITGTQIESVSDNICFHFPWP